MQEKKDVGIRIRVETKLRDDFVQSCREQGLAASEVLRDFMRAYTEMHQRGQGSLFVDSQ